jgi:hapalindole biogenesis HpiC1 cyclase-like protein
MKRPTALQLSSVGTVLAVIATANVALAVDINIPNFSFEADQVPAGGSALGNANWTSTGDFGRFHAGGDLGQTGSPPNGTQVAFLNSNGADAYQTLTDVFVGGGMYYFLNIDMAKRDNFDNSRSMVFSLYANGDPNNTVAAFPRNGNSLLLSDQFLRFGLVATPGDIIAAGALNQTIGIRFRGTGVDGYFDIDNVHLVADVIPEPSALALFAMCALVACRQRPLRSHRRRANLT